MLSLHYLAYCTAQGIFLGTAAVQLGFADIVALFCYSAMVMSLSMYVMV